jgi:outer membrane protein
MRISPAIPLLAAALAAAPAAAQETADGLRTATVGAGIQTYPRYPGASAQRTGPLPLVDVDRPGAPIRFKAPDQGLGFGLLGRGSRIDFGPAVQWEYSRRAGRDVPAGIPDVGFTVEAGGFVQTMLGESVRVRAEGRQGIGGHKGAVLDLSADALLRPRGGATLFSIGPRLRLSDGRYQRTWFGVTPAAAAATGLPSFTPRAGVHAAGLWSSVRQRLGGPWGVYGFAGYDRLIGDAGDSPLVRRYGRRDQLSAGAALTYSFGLRLPRL